MGNGRACITCTVHDLQVEGQASFQEPSCRRQTCLLPHPPPFRRALCAVQSTPSARTPFPPSAAPLPALSTHKTYRCSTARWRAKLRFIALASFALIVGLKLSNDHPHSHPPPSPSLPRSQPPLVPHLASSTMMPEPWLTDWCQSRRPTAPCAVRLDRSATSSEYGNYRARAMALTFIFADVSASIYFSSPASPSSPCQPHTRTARARGGHSSLR